jgi:hypothetical protein
MGQLGFFDAGKRLEALSAKGDPALCSLPRQVHTKPRKLPLPLFDGPDPRLAS